MTPKTRSKSSSKARPLSGAPQPEKPLPDDIQTLQAMVRALQHAVSSRDDQIAQLQHTIAQLRRQVYGTKSEKLQQALHDAELQLEDLVADQGQDPQREEPGLVDDDSKGDGHGDSDSPSSVLLDLPPLPDKPDAPRKPPGGRKPLPAHLPRDEHRLTPAEPVCTQCSGELKPLGDDVTERLDYVGAHFRVRREIRPRCCCTKCGQIVQAPVAVHPLPKALLTAGTLAHLLSSKYADHCPLYRQREIYARDGLNLSLSSMAHWVGQAQGLLKPLVQALHQYVMAAPAAVHVDDTGLPVLGRVQGKAHRASLWVYVRDERPWAATSAPAVVFHYTHSREGKHPAEHLAGFAGAVQADAYSGFDQLFGEDSGRTEVGCWAHVRRKFFEITAADKTQKGITINTVNRVLLLIGKLYHVERVVLGQSHQDRLKARTTYSRPVIEALWATMQAARAEQSKKSPIIGAINYATNHWQALTAYLDDGRREIDNNAAERALRCVALGRKNYMFAGSDNGGHAAAAMYSLIGSAKLNGLNPEHYLAYVLQQMGASQGDEGFDVTSLLPWHVAAVIDPSAKPVAVELGVSEAEAAELSE